MMVGDLGIVALVAVLAVISGAALIAVNARRPHLLFYLTLALLPTQVMFFPVADFFISPADVLVVGGLTGVMCRLALGRRSSWMALWQHRYLGLMLLAYVVGFLALGVFSRTIVRPAVGIVPSILACDLLKTRKQLARASLALLAGGVFDAISGASFYARGIWLHPTRFAGIGGPNFSAMVIMAAAVIAFATFGRTRQPVKLVAPGILTGFGFATLSQMGALSFVCAWVSVLRWVVRRDNKIRVFAAAAVIALLALSQGTVRERLLQRNERELQIDGVSRNSADVRLMVLRVFWSGLRENPLFGVGYSQFQPFSTTDIEIYTSTGGTGYGTHNSYLEVLVEGGLLAFLPFVLHFVQYGRRLKSIWTAIIYRHDIVVAAAVAGLPIAIVSAGLANVLLYYSFWAVCGVALACGNVLLAERRQVRLALTPVGATA